MALEYRTRSRSQSQESGYASATSSTESLQDVIFTVPHLKYLNAQLARLEPLDILRWCLLSLPQLYQTTAFGLTGLVTLDMLSKISDEQRNNHPVDLIFLDTLFHFKETLHLVNTIRARYPGIDIHVYKPQNVNNADEFSALYGNKLWETDDHLYDFVAKVEPAQRAYAELNVKAVLTGRRKSQGGKRGSLDIIEVDEAGLIKVNPLANWTFQQVKEYIDKNNVPYNALLNRGYKSIGDWHSTSQIKEGEDERAGRWKGQQKTECGIHNPRSKYAQFLMDQERNNQEQALTNSLRSAVPIVV